MKFVTKTSDNLTDLWIQRLKNMFNWNIRDSLKPIKKTALTLNKSSYAIEEVKK